MININFKDRDYTDAQLSNIIKWVETVSREFEKSHNFQTLNAVEQHDFEFLISVFFEYCYSYCLVGPGEIDKDIIDEMMLDVMPRKVSAELSTFEAFAPVMTQFLQWCEEKHYMKNVKVICDYINQIALEMIRRSQNPEYWGMAKSMMMGGPMNVNLGNDYSQVTSDTNQISNVMPVRRDKPKIGRNDPCECGSGKKYKKCCLN